MEPRELQEQTEHAQRKGEKGIGLTMAIVAVLLAVVTQLSHRAHTEEVKLQTKVNDGWQFYQAKHGRAHEYGKYAENEVVANQNDLAMKDLKISIAEECGSPVEGNCTSPVLKESAVLKQLVKQSTAAKTEEHFDPAEGTPKNAATPREGSPSPHKKAREERGARKEGAVDIQDRTHELEKETDLITSKADIYDSAELFLEISIVLCSIALLAEAKLYWRLSFVSTVIGVGIAVWGWFMH
jgi:Domain of unknown function (DUF4337)